jgi:hypothetical protein
MTPSLDNGRTAELSLARILIRGPRRGCAGWRWASCARGTAALGSAVEAGESDRAEDLAVAVTPTVTEFTELPLEHWMSRRGVNVWVGRGFAGSLS